MSQASALIAGAYAHAAATARTAEEAYRKTAAAEIARLASHRVTAFRRVRLVEILEKAAAATPAGEDALAAQQRRLCHEIGWTGEPEAQRAVLNRLEPVCLALQPPEGRPALPTVQVSLEAFERWFEADRKVSFYALFDIHVQETPVVDF